MVDRNANWLGTVEQHAESIVNSFGGYLTFQDLKTIVLMANQIFEDIDDDNTDLTPREKVVALVEYVLDNTDTPWLDDSMSDPFMKAIAPFIVEYIMPEEKGSNANEDDCIWRRCGNGLFFGC